MHQQSPRWAFMMPFDIYAKDGSGDVYLHRLRIVQTPLFAIYLHDLNMPDNDRDPHDHPWSFWSLVLRGGYNERVWRIGDGRPTVKRHRRFSLHRMKSEGVAHMIDIVQPRTKTLILAGRRHRNWGFWTERGWVPWQEYV